MKYEQNSPVLFPGVIIGWLKSKSIVYRFLFKVMENSQCSKIMFELMFAHLNYFTLHF